MSRPSRPQAMRVDDSRCTLCELCTLIAPVIRHHPRCIPVTSDTLEAMAQCPTGAIVWREDDLIRGTPPRAGSHDGRRLLDLRSLAPRDRHAAILAAYDALVPGEALELLSDHDPQALYRRFRAERRGRVRWQALLQGPETWCVKIGRT